ncbi:MAG: NAD(P)-dependent oxidoreductase [Candidatus Latescibacterota bacterium]|nr:NAD(P)-dependent oxidoreductase [Candidatus Latescibacterota bacterium]
MAQKLVGITGGAGTIGQVLKRELDGEYKFRLLDRTGGEDISTVRFDDLEEVSGSLDGLDAVIHLAANPSPEGEWSSVLADNIEATYLVTEECRQAGVRRLIFASTNHTQHGNTMLTTPETLDPTRELLMRTEDPPNPDSLYAVSKLFGENLGKYYSEQHGLEFVALRIGWIVPDDQPESKKGTRAEDYMRAMWLSHRDCGQVMRCALETPLSFFVAYATSDNSRRVFDLTRTRRVLGYSPQDNAESRFAD